jgi:hypothetical protein
MNGLAPRAGLVATGGLVALLTGCGAEPAQRVALGLYELTPEQCETVHARYMTALVDPASGDDDLDRLTCQVNKCAAMEQLAAGLDGHDGYDVGEQTRFAYAPEALGGQPCR